MSPPLEDESPMEVDELMSVNEINLDNVLNIVKRTMQKGEAWYLVDKKWYEQFEEFVKDKEPSHNPGPIDNSKLLSVTKDGLCELKDNLEEEIDYKFVPEDAWHMLVGYFTIQGEGHVIQRWVIQEGVSPNFCVVEVYLTELDLCLYEKPKKFITQQYSRTTTLHDLEEDMKRIFSIDGRETRIYHLETVLDTSDGKTLADASISNGDIVTLEAKYQNGNWPSNQGRSANTRSSNNVKVHTPGVCGLTNLGNTCFMNSALQCLSNTPPLTQFITSDKYLDEINRNNPLGMDGKIAEAYGDMIKNMWSGTMSCFTPREFKYVVGGFAPQFSGYAQQDSQELMAFLLDGLHEDLNRITKKPYIEMKTDVDRRPDNEVAKESWENYKKRNDSIIVDTFHGLLKSTLVCPDCKLVSVTFDPFCYLSLPLPTKKDKQIDVIFVPVSHRPDDANGNEDDRKIAFKLTGLTVPKYGSMIDISKALANAVNKEGFVPHKIDPSKLILVEISTRRIQKIFENDEAIPANTKELVVYEKPDNKFIIPVYLREDKPDGRKAFFGRPMLIGIDEPTYDTIYEAVADKLKKYSRDPSVDSSESDEGVAECQNGTESFSLRFTNSFGTMDMEKLERDKPIQLNGVVYLALELSEKSRKNFDVEYDSPKKVVLPRVPNSSKSSIPLSECITNFTKTETLGANDLWYCPTCKEHKQATKKFDIWDLPNVLIIHLKRFSYSRYWRDKLDTMIEYPIVGLDMGVHVENNPDKKPMNYDLIAVSNHYGGLGGGHYAAYAKNSQTDKWYYFNDSSVSGVSKSDVVSKDGYVLYYLKRDT